MPEQEKEISREDMVEALVADAIESVEQNIGDNEWLEDILKNGVVGFANMTNDDLQRAYDDAGLGEFPGEGEEE